MEQAIYTLGAIVVAWLAYRLARAVGLVWLFSTLFDIASWLI